MLFQLYIWYSNYQLNEITTAQFGHSFVQRLYEDISTQLKIKNFRLFLSQDWSADDLTNEELAGDSIILNQSTHGYHLCI